MSSASVTASGPREAGGAALDRFAGTRLATLFVAGFLTPTPVSASAIFISEIARDLETPIAVVGGLRGVGGVSALVAGLLVAPLIDRYPRAWTVAFSLAVLAAGSATILFGTLPALIVFYVATGIGTALLMPLIQAASVDGVRRAAASRVAALIAASTPLGSATCGLWLAPALWWWGWPGVFWTIIALAFAAAVICVAMLSRRRPDDVARIGYLATFPAVVKAPGATALLLAGAIFAANWNGVIVTYLAAYFAEAFAFDAIGIAIVWLVGAGGVFVGTFVGGRYLNRADQRWRWLNPYTLLIGGLVWATIWGPVIYISPTGWFGALAEMLFGFGAGAQQAGLVGLIVERFPTVRGAMLSLQRTGSNIGYFTGAAIGGAALAISSYAALAGLALALSVVAIGAAAIGVHALRRADAAAASLV